MRNARKHDIYRAGNTTKTKGTIGTMPPFEITTDERIMAAQEALLALHNWNVDQLILLEKGDAVALANVTNNLPRAWKLLGAFDPARFA